MLCRSRTPTAVPALHPVLAVVHSARELLPARRARPWCLPLAARPLAGVVLVLGVVLSVGLKI